MFPQTRWSSGLLVATALIALALTARADESLCTEGSKAPECEQCKGLSAQKCCSNPKLLSKCQSCISADCSISRDSNDVTGRFKREPSWKESDNDLDRQLALWKNSGDELEEDKRAKYFLGKRAKYFLGKREDDGFNGLGEYQDDMDEEKRAKYFLGKRAKYFLGKRAKYFLGKRDYADDEDQQMAPARRAKYFLGKRAKYFLGKRDDDDEYDSRKRAKYFLGKRYFDDDEYPTEEKRQKYFLGKRSTDNAARQ